MLLTCLPLTGQFKTSVFIDTSSTVGDRFEIYVSVPATYTTAKKYKAVYYLDANLKSGKKIRQLLNEMIDSTQLQSVIFIGIGHTGNYHALRRRDFMLTPIKGSDTAPEKEAVTVRNFYTYLKTELLPKMQRNYAVYKDSNSIMGHSFGGLFVFYCLFQNNPVFNKFFALSPSLWAGNNAVYYFNKIGTGFTSDTYLYFAAGSVEKLNRILNGTSRMKRFLDEHHYTGLRYEYEIIPGKAHNSEVPLTLQKILTGKLE